MNTHEARSSPEHYWAALRASGGSHADAARRLGIPASRITNAVSYHRLTGRLPSDLLALAPRRSQPRRRRSTPLAERPPLNSALINVRAWARRTGMGLENARAYASQGRLAGQVEIELPDARTRYTLVPTNAYLLGPDEVPLDLPVIPVLRVADWAEQQGLSVNAALWLHVAGHLRAWNKPGLVVPRDTPAPSARLCQRAERIVGRFTATDLILLLSEQGRSASYIHRVLGGRMSLSTVHQTRSRLRRQGRLDPRRIVPE